MCMLHKPSLVDWRLPRTVIANLGVNVMLQQAGGGCPCFTHITGRQHDDLVESRCDMWLRAPPSPAASTQEACWLVAPARVGSFGHCRVAVVD